VRNGGETDHWSAYRWLGAMLDKYRPDLIWTSLTRATLLGQAAGAALRVPVVSWQHAAYLRPANKRLLRLRRRRYALWVAESCSVAAFSRESLGLSDDHLLVWPIFAADPDAERAKAWVSGEPVRIGTLGRLHPVKGYDVLLDAIQIVRAANPSHHPFRLAIGGTGSEHANLQSRITRKRLANVDLVGFVQNPPGFLARQHLYVQPSRSEGFCIAAHQAMQAGLPVIGSAVGEMAHSIAHGTTGRLVAPDNAIALADAISQSLEQAPALGAMGEAARERVLQRFSRSRFDQRAGEILKRLDDLCRTGRRISP